MNPVAIAVISDLHVGGSRARDLSPSGPHDNLDADYIERFCSFVSANKLAADVLLCPGDATHRLDPAEAALASTTIKTVAQALGVAPSNVFYTPGNHDVDWSVLRTPDPTGYRLTQRFAPLAAGCGLLEQLCRQGTGGLLQEPYVTVIRADSIVVACVNTVAHDDPSATVHHGAVSQASIEELSHRLRAIPYSENELRICLVHHHPIQYSNPLPDQIDFSVMANAENLLATLRQHRFDLLAHGHRHAPKFSAQVVDGSHPLLILGAGSFSAKLDTRWSGIVANQFHLLSVDRRGDQGTIQGELKSWAYLAHPGWVKSVLPHGIEHSRLFGLHLLPNELANRLQATVALGTLPVTSHELFQRDQELKYVPLPALEAALATVCERLSATRYGELSEDFVLVQNQG